MECVFGMACQDFTILAADSTSIHSILVMKNDDDKIHKLSNNIIMGVTGESGDTCQFAEFVAKNIQLYKMRNGYNLSTSSAAHFTRFNLADYLRSQSPYQVNLLLGGYDHDEGGQLYFMDYLASSQKLSFGAHGYGGIMVTSILQRYYKRNLTVEQAYDILKRCVQEIQKRFLVNLSIFTVKVVGPNGITILEPIKSQLPVAA